MMMMDDDVDVDDDDDDDDDDDIPCSSTLSHFPRPSYFHPLPRPTPITHTIITPQNNNKISGGGGRTTG